MRRSVESRFAALRLEDSDTAGGSRKRLFHAGQSGFPSNYVAVRRASPGGDFKARRHVYGDLFRSALCKPNRELPFYKRGGTVTKSALPAQTDLLRLFHPLARIESTRSWAGIETDDHLVTNRAFRSTHTPTINVPPLLRSGALTVCLLRFVTQRWGRTAPCRSRSA